MRSTTVTRRAETDHRSCSGGPAPGPRSMLPSRLCGSLPADPSLTPTGPHEPPSGQPRSPCFTLRPGANRLLLAPTDLMVGVLSACYTRRPQGVTHRQSRCTVLSVRRRVGRDPPQIPKLRMSTPVADRLWRALGGKSGGSRAKQTWQPPHVLGLHQRSEPVLCARRATMAWKRSGVRVP